MRGRGNITKSGALFFKSIHINIRSASFASPPPASLTFARNFGDRHSHSQSHSHSHITMAPRDPNTLANYGEWLTKHTTVNLKVNFEKQRLEGSVLLELESLTDKKSQEVILGVYFSSAVCSHYWGGLGAR
jgi:hypothetical protein